MSESGLKRIAVGSRLAIPTRLQGSLPDLDLVRLDHVADLDVVVAGDLHAALEALADLADVVLEPLEDVQRRPPARPAGR